MRICMIMSLRNACDICSKNERICVRSRLYNMQCELGRYDEKFGEVLYVYVAVNEPAGFFMWERRGRPPSRNVNST